MKTYSSKANARRALKSFGETATANADTLMSQEDGKWGFDPEHVKAYVDGMESGQQEHLDTMKSNAKKQRNEEDQDLIDTYGTQLCPHCNIHLSNGAASEDSEHPKHEKYLHVCLGCGEEFGPELEKKVAKPQQNHSSINQPCREVWTIAEKMREVNPDVKRKEVLEACVKAGIAYYTARTQYQQWLQATKASQQ